MAYTPVKKGAGRPRKTPGAVKKKAKYELPIKNPLRKVMHELRELHRNGEIVSLTENKHIINTNYEYIYVSFKIPKKEVKE